MNLFSKVKNKYHLFRNAAKNLYFRMPDQFKFRITNLVDDSKNKILSKLNLNKYNQINHKIYKQDYDILLKQDNFWFRSVTWGIIGTAVFCISWISIAKTDEIILVSGKIIPLGDIKEIQMPIGGVARKILVKEGDIVNEGDLLIELDKESSIAEFKTLKESLNLQNNQLELKINEFISYIDSKKKDIAFLKSIEDLDRKIMNKFEFLFNEGAVAEIDYLRQKLKAQQSLKLLTSAESEIEIKSKIYKQDLDVIRSRINDINGLLAENNIKQRYQSLVSPVKGVVFDIKPKSTGYAAQVTETILKIVPDGDLVARIEIPSKDIGFVKDGMNVDISIDSYPATDFGVITGNIKSISSDALEPDQKAQRNVYSYPAKIRLNSQSLILDNGNELNLKAGMSLNASIKLRKVSYLQLLLSGFKNKTDSLKQL